MKTEELKRMLEVLRNAPDENAESEYPTLTHELAEKLNYPRTFYQVDSAEDSEAAVIQPVTALEYSLAPGASIKTIVFRREGESQKARGSVNLFYVSEDAARLECDETNALLEVQRAKDRLAGMQAEMLEQLIEAREILQDAREFLSLYPESRRANAIVDRIDALEPSKPSAKPSF